MAKNSRRNRKKLEVPDGYAPQEIVAEALARQTEAVEIPTPSDNKANTPPNIPPNATVIHVGPKINNTEKPIYRTGPTPETAKRKPSHEISAEEKMISLEEDIGAFGDGERRYVQKWVDIYPNELLQAIYDREKKGGKITDKAVAALRLWFIDHIAKWGMERGMAPEKSDLIEKYLELKLPHGIPPASPEELHISEREAIEKTEKEKKSLKDLNTKNEHMKDLLRIDSELQMKRVKGADQIMEFRSKDENDMGKQEQREKIRAQIVEALRKDHEKRIKEFERDREKQGSVTDFFIEEENSGFNIVNQYGVDIILDSLEELNLPDGSDKDADAKIGESIKKLRSMKYLLIHEKISPDSEIGKPILEALGIRKQAGFSDWKNINERDMSDFYGDVVEYNNSATKEIFELLFRSHPDALKRFLATGNNDEILKVVQDTISPKFKELLDQVTADTSERIERRKKYAIEKIVDPKFGINAVYNDNYIIPLVETAAKENSLEAKKEDIETSVVRIRERITVLKKNVIDYIYTMHRGKLERDAYKNYVPINREAFKVVVEDVVKMEIREIIKEVIAERKPEDAVEISWTPEQQKIIGVIKDAIKLLYAKKKAEADSWEGFTDKERENMLIMMMNGALRTQYDKRMAPLNAPKTDEAIEKFIDDILRDIK